jgi:selenide,water dikinase
VSKRDLTEVLRALPEFTDSRVLVGCRAGDDAAVVLLPEKSATILTIDVFTPSVDDPYTFGQIAAANAVSDIYAMGGTPQCALSLIGFPVNTLPLRVMQEILRGGIDKLQEAGISVVGGHSLKDQELKFGFAVVGSAPQNGFLRNQGAQIVDVLVLTKPLGNGILSFAAQCGRAPERGMAEAMASMCRLNEAAGSCMANFAAHAATDVTGFGLLGHLAEIVKNDALEVELDFDRIPFFSGVEELAHQGVLPGAIERNREAVPQAMLELEALHPAEQEMLFGPETSGGLLVFLPEDGAQGFIRQLNQRQIDTVATIGRVVGQAAGGRIRLRHSKAKNEAQRPRPSPARPQDASPKMSAPADRSPSPGCCAEEVQPLSLLRACPDEKTLMAAAPPAGGLVPLLPQSRAAYATYFAAMTATEALEPKTRELLCLALSVLAQCEGCVKINTDKALSAGAEEAEVAEAVALAIAFGGAPVSMFYQTLLRQEERRG